MTATTSLSTGSDHIQMIPNLMYLNRVKAEIPVIKMGCEYIEQLITGIKESSTALEWSLNKATSGMDQVVKYPLPYMLRDPLIAVDRFLCTSLDLTELNMPVLTKTPHEIYEESVEYVLAIVTPITDWVDMELLPPAEYYVDRYLPELNPDQKLEQVNNEKSSKACQQFTVKLTHRIKQHAYAESKYLVKLLYIGYEESALIMKIVIFDPKLLSKTFRQIWKKISDGVTPDEAASSLLLMEMGCIELRKYASLFIQMIEINGEMAKCYIEMFLRYINMIKNHIVDNLSRVVNSAIKEHGNTTIVQK